MKWERQKCIQNFGGEAFWKNGGGGGGSLEDYIMVNLKKVMMMQDGRNWFGVATSSRLLHCVGSSCSLLRHCSYQVTGSQ
jgi:hypothetical protein